MPPTLRPSILGMLTVLGSIACGGGDGGPTAPSGPTSLNLAAGGQQTGQAGKALVQPITVRALRGTSPAAGAQVTFAVVAGGGILSRTTATTDNTGSATVTWTLGGQLGEQSMTATTGTLPSVTVTATAEAGDPSSLVPVAGNSQFAVVNRPLPIRPRVQLSDAFGNPTAGKTVTFTLTSTGGAISGTTQTTDANGFAELGGWTLSAVPGSNTVLAAFSPTVATELVAFGTAAAVTPLSGDGQTANAGTAVPLAPTILAVDGDGQPLAGVQIIFNVVSGGGSVSGPIQTTNAQGKATVTKWILGAAAGPNQLHAIAFGIIPNVVFTATGIPGVPASAVATGPTAFTGLVGNFAAAAPTVVVTDASGKPVAGAPVSFEVLSGGGSVATSTPALGEFAGFASLVGSSINTDADGAATLRSWRLGPGVGPQAIQATVAALPPIQFTATAEPLPPAEFNIEVRFPSGDPSPTVKAAFLAAAARWQELILGDIADELAQFPADPSGCFPAIDEVIDDVIIFAEVVPIDGVNGVLGSAGPCLIRDNFLPGVGRMRFDSADLAALETSGQLVSVILHEMGHVLGIGSLWGLQELLGGTVSADPFFTGISARAAWIAAAQALGFTGNIVPVEGGNVPGTSGSHWRESVARNELMTGFLNSGENPLSAFTVASLRDQGYVVNDAAAEPFTLAPLLTRGASTSLTLRETPLPGPIYIMRRGRIVGTRIRPPL